ncbi:hypothetical protein K502DRAFT_106826 [Neoconidiobolus thromboides FSU 785]|nr:hypothetical protein K502DRAFT_106826 [Neoconidiobolus thromboides FSU 785]
MYQDITCELEFKKTDVICDKLILKWNVELPTDLKSFLLKFLTILNKNELDLNLDYNFKKITIPIINQIQNRILLTDIIYLITCDILPHYKDHSLLTNSKAIPSKLNIFDIILKFLTDNLSFIKLYDKYFINLLFQKLILETFRGLSSYLFILGANCNKQQETLIKAILIPIKKTLDPTSLFIKKTNSLKILRFSLNCISTLYSQLSSKYLSSNLKQDIIENILLLIKGIICKEMITESNYSHISLERNKVSR